MKYEELTEEYVVDLCNTVMTYVTTKKDGPRVSKCREKIKTFLGRLSSPTLWAIYREAVKIGREQNLYLGYRRSALGLVSALCTHVLYDRPDRLVAGSPDDIEFLMASLSWFDRQYNNCYLTGVFE